MIGIPYALAKMAYFNRINNRHFQILWTTYACL